MVQLVQTDVMEAKVRPVDLAPEELEVLEALVMMEALVCPEVKEKVVQPETLVTAVKTVYPAVLEMMDVMDSPVLKVTLETLVPLETLVMAVPLELKEQWAVVVYPVVMDDLEILVLLVLKETLDPQESEHPVPKERLAVEETPVNPEDQETVEIMEKTVQPVIPEPLELKEILETLETLVVTDLLVCLVLKAIHLL